MSWHADLGKSLKDLVRNPVSENADDYRSAVPVMLNLYSWRMKDSVKNGGSDTMDSRERSDLSK